MLSEDDIAERAPAKGRGVRDLQVTKTRRFHARKIDAVQWGATFIPVPVGERAGAAHRSAVRGWRSEKVKLHR